MKRSRIVVASLAALVVLLFVLSKLVGGFERRETAGPESPAVADEKVLAAEPAPTAGEGIAPSAGSSERDVVDAATTPAIVESSPEAVRPVKLRGRVIVEEVDGREISGLDGSFELFVWRGEDGDESRVTFAAGEWSKEIEEPGSVTGLSTIRVEVGSRVAKVLDPSERIRMPESGELVIRARFHPALVLEVLDAVSGAHLRGIAIVKALPYAARSLTHPGLDFADRLVAEGLDSPLALDSMAS